MEYLWILVALFTALLGVFLWVKRRHDDAKRSFENQRRKSVFSFGSEVATSIDDTAPPAVLDYKAVSEP
jgi:hypothetical protein